MLFVLATIFATSIKAFQVSPRKSIPNRETITSIFTKPNKQQDETAPLALPPYLGMPRTTTDNELAFKSLMTNEEFDGNVAQTQFAPPKFQLQYTCNICEERNINMVSRKAYREGVVIAVCKGCNTKHMIADNLGWSKYAGGFNDGETNIEEFFQNRGESDSVHRVSIDAWDLEKLYRANKEDPTSNG